MTDEPKSKQLFRAALSHPADSPECKRLFGEFLAALYEEHRRQPPRSAPDDSIKESAAFRQRFIKAFDVTRGADRVAQLDSMFDALHDYPPDSPEARFLKSRLDNLIFGPPTEPPPDKGILRIRALYRMLEETEQGTSESWSIAGRIVDSLGRPRPGEIPDAPPARLTDAEWRAAERAELRLRDTDRPTADAILDYVVATIFTIVD